jgi:hypothetical protein
VYDLSNLTNQSALVAADNSEPAPAVPAVISEQNLQGVAIETDTPAASATQIYTAALAARGLSTVSAATTPKTAASAAFPDLHAWVKPSLLVETSHEDLITLGPSSGSVDLLQFVVTHALNPAYTSALANNPGTVTEPPYDRSVFGIDLWLRRFYHNERKTIGGGGMVLRKFSESIQVLDSGN